jgi:hypothetical protein
VDYTNAQSYKQTRAWGWARETWLGDWVRACRGYRWALSARVNSGIRCGRELWAWARSQEIAVPTVEQLSESIATLAESQPHPSDGHKDSEAPIFLLSTGWRAGSTLLQRVLLTDPSLLLWGEPLGEMTIVPGIAQVLSHRISPRNLWLWKKQLDPTSISLATDWVANLYPPAEDFRLAVRTLFDRWLGETAHQRGFARWGFKEVRLGAAEATLLHWLYPRAKFVIISRHPYDCYRSLWDSGWGSFYYRHPDLGIDSVAQFARVWNRLAVSWRELPAGFPCFHIKYEDLIEGKVNFRELESWLGIEVKEEVALSVRVGATAKRQRLSWYERFIIASAASPGMHALGYTK